MEDPGARAGIADRLFSAGKTRDLADGSLGDHRRKHAETGRLQEKGNHGGLWFGDARTMDPDVPHAIDPTFHQNH
jgi:hypothetical protein